MCQKSEERIHHLFVECDFARDCCQFLVRPLEVRSQQMLPLHELLSTWKKTYPYTQNKWNFVKINTNLNIYSSIHIQLIGTAILPYYILCM